jgi:hypothetical protein
MWLRVQGKAQYPGLPVCLLPVEPVQKRNAVLFFSLTANGLNLVTYEHFEPTRNTAMST